MKHNKKNLLIFSILISLLSVSCEAKPSISEFPSDEVPSDRTDILSDSKSESLSPTDKATETDSPSSTESASSSADHKTESPVLSEDVSSESAFETEEFVTSSEEANIPLYYRGHVDFSKRNAELKTDLHLLIKTHKDV